MAQTVLKDIFLIGRFGGEEQQEDNRVHLGNAIMSFYSALIDLLGRCAPEMHVSWTMLFRALNSLRPQVKICLKISVMQYLT